MNMIEVLAEYFCVRDCSEKPGVTAGSEDLQRKARPPEFPGGTPKRK